MQDSNITAIPAVITNIVGKKCVFDIKINAYNTDRGYEEFTVYRLTECAIARTEDEENEVGEAANKKRKTAKCWNTTSTATGAIVYSNKNKLILFIIFHP